MRQHLFVPSVVEVACHVVWHLAASSNDNKVALASAGACKAVVDALWTHISMPDVAKAACGAIWNLAASNADNKETLARAGERKRTRLNSSHSCASRMPSSARPNQLTTTPSLTT